MLMIVVTMMMVMMKIVLALTWPFLKLGPQNFTWQQTKILPKESDDEDDENIDDDDYDYDYSCNSAN